MPSRIIRDGFNSSLRINALSIGAECLYHRLLLVADDFGRFHGSVITLRGACWPTNPEKVSEREVGKWFTEILRGDDPLVKVYSEGGATYIEIQNFQQRPRTKSRFPAPPWHPGSIAQKGQLGSISPSELCGKTEVMGDSKGLIDQNRDLTTDNISVDRTCEIAHFDSESFTVRELRDAALTTCGQSADICPQNAGTRRIAYCVLRIAKEPPIVPQQETEECAPETGADAENEILTPPNSQGVVRSAVPTPIRRRAHRTIKEIERALGDRMDWWEKFWGVYPCHESRQGAMDAFERRFHDRDEALKAYYGAEKYAAKALADPTMKLKYGQGWINDERWRDENRIQPAASKFQDREIDYPDLMVSQ